MKCKVCEIRQAEIGYNVCKKCTISNFMVPRQKEIIVTLQVIKLDEPYGEPFCRVFDSEESLAEYIRKSHQAYFSIEIISRTEKDKNDNLC